MVANQESFDDNVFFTSKITAEDYLASKVADPDSFTLKEDWRIETLTEGHRFEADFLGAIPTVLKLDPYGDPITEEVL